MSAIKGPEKPEFEEFVKHKASQRVKKLKWWFVILIIIGMAFLVFGLFSNVSSLFGSSNGSETNILNIFISTAIAEKASQSVVKNQPSKAIIMAGIFSVLGIVYIASIYKVFFSTNPDNVDSVTDLLKTLTGFFVGVGTSFFG